MHITFKDKKYMNKLLTPQEFINYTGLQLKESTLATARTTGQLGKILAPMFTTVVGKPYYRVGDVDTWLEGLPAYTSNAEHGMAA